MTVTVVPVAMVAVSRDAVRAVADARRRIHDARRLATGLPAGPERRRLEVALADGDRLLARLSRVMARPGRVAAAMLDLDRRSRDVVGPARPGVVAARVRRDLDALVARGSSPVAVAACWARLPPARRTALLDRHGPAVANLDGIPITVRDAVHRATIAAEVDRLSRSAAGPSDQPVVSGNDVVGPIRHREVTARLNLLARLAAADHVLALDLAGDGRAVLAVGDPDTAAHVATVVPGIGTTLRDTGRLLDEARTLHDRTVAAGGGDVATIAWLGYDTPPGPLEALAALSRNDATDAVLATSTLVADRAVEPLARHAAGVRAGNPGVHHTLVGHSYGSVVTLRAVGTSRRRTDVDDVVVLGSPGAGVDRAELAWPDDVGLWSATAASDPVPRLPVLGPDAVTLGAVPLAQGPGNHGHVRYLAPGTFGLAAVALVVAGKRGCPIPPSVDAHAPGQPRRPAAW